MITLLHMWHLYAKHHPCRISLGCQTEDYILSSFLPIFPLSQETLEGNVVPEKSAVWWQNPSKFAPSFCTYVSAFCESKNFISNPLATMWLTVSENVTQYCISIDMDINMDNSSLFLYVLICLYLFCKNKWNTFWKQNVLYFSLLM